MSGDSCVPKGRPFVERLELSHAWISKREGSSLAIADFLLAQTKSRFASEQKRTLAGVALCWLSFVPCTKSSSV